MKSFEGAIIVLGVGVGMGNGLATGIRQSSKQPIVIGQTMADVKSAARARGATWYKAWNKFFEKKNFNMQKSLKRNERWIKRQMKEGREIFDIGLDPTKARRSPFYDLETKILDAAGYKRTPIPRP